jgi:hypothetical protein
MAFFPPRTTITTAHQKSHAGDLFTISRIFAGVAAGSAEILIRIPPGGRTHHTVFSVAVGAIDIQMGVVFYQAR